MPTPDRFPGIREEDEVQFIDQGPGNRPTEVGGVVFADDTLWLKASARNINLGGITEAEHDTLDDLVHHLAESHFLEIIRAAGKVSSVIAWTDALKTKKVREVLVTRAAGKVSQVDLVQYNSGGAETQRMTGIITRSSGKVSSITWTETGS